MIEIDEDYIYMFINTSKKQAKFSKRNSDLKEGPLKRSLGYSIPTKINFPERPVDSVCFSIADQTCQLFLGNHALAVPC